jgi:hypothetical protein
MEVKKTQAVLDIEKHGATGANALWNGPIDLSGFPKGQGYSGGKNGMKLKMAGCGCYCDSTGYTEPITKRAKVRG